MDLSGAALFASMIVGSVGLAFFVYGKKQVRVPQLVVGIAMMVYPCFVSSAAVTYAIAAALIVAVWVAVRLGH